MSESNKVGFVSLGCAKALVDSERIITGLQADGYAMAEDFSEADLVVINTCGFTENAIEESLQAIDESMVENGKVIVTGCLGAKQELIRRKFPNVLGVTGPEQFTTLAQMIRDALPLQSPRPAAIPMTGIKLTPSHYAYVKISEGCNHHCTFCIIPGMRGPLVSRPIEDVLREVEGLVSAGVGEIMIISQDTSAYGSDLKYPRGFWQGRPLRTRFEDLVVELERFDAWFRLHYVYPYPHVDRVIPLLNGNHVLPYLDVPLQHASPAVLKRMRRPADSENMLNRIEQWRRDCPNICLRSTFIVGFPGETEADFEQLLAFIQHARLDRVGCFPYSAVEGAQANQLDGAVPEAVKQERYHRFMQAQKRVSEAKLQSRVGEVMTVIVDESGPDGTVARSYLDAPEDDGVVYLPAADHWPGQRLRVRITDADSYDLYAQVVE